MCYLVSNGEIQISCMAMYVIMLKLVVTLLVGLGMSSYRAYTCMVSSRGNISPDELANIIPLFLIDSIADH